MKIRGTATDNLADVIQSLQLIHKSGLLTVERDSADQFSELGAIVFQQGRIVEAQVGQLKGADAYKKLLTWTTCRFVFEAAQPSAMTALPMPIRPNGPPSGGGNQDTPSSPISNVPCRAQHFQNIVPDFSHVGLSRLHRQVFLLIDGKRSLQELARIIGRHPQDVVTVLADLARTGLINPL